jgi:glycine dehydrogenase subunit 1
MMQTIHTYLIPVGMEPVLVKMKGGAADLEDLSAKIDEQTASVLVTSPNYFGIIEEIDAIAQITHTAGAKLIVSANPIACGLLKSPGSMGADIVVGEGQPLGIPLSFGGPYLGFMACTEKLMRKLPGRIVGQTQDSQQRRAFVLTLQAREQHIRREKAGSNICSNQAWCALRSAIYMSLMGPQGLRDVAQQCFSNAHYLKDCLEAIGFKRIHDKEFFHEFVTSCNVDYAQMQTRLDKESILGGLSLRDGTILWCATELTGKTEIDRLIRVLEGKKA